MKKIVLVPLLGLPTLALLILASTYLIPVRESSLDKIKWTTFPQLISIHDVTREGRQGLLLERLKDGKEQFIAGDWKSSYSAQGDLMLVGKFPEGYSSTTGQHLYMVKNDKIFSVPLDKLEKTVTSVQISYNQAYLLFGMQDGDKTAFCVMEWAQQGPAECPAINAENISKGRWNPDNGHELLAITASGTIYSVDPWEKGIAEPKEITADNNLKLHSQAEKILTDEREPAGNETTAPTHKTFLRIFNLALIHDSSGWSIHRVPVTSTLYWLNDGSHLLIKEPDRIGIYELASRSYTGLLSETNIGEKEITYRNKADKAL